MDLQEIKNIIEEICSSPELLDNGDFNNEKCLLNSYKGQQIPKCIKKSFTKLYSILENELSEFIENISSGNSREGNVSPSKLLSLLDKNYILSLKERCSTRKNEEFVAELQQDVSNNGNDDNIDILNLEENNYSPNANRNIHEKHLFFHRHQPKLELEFIEQISISPNILVANSPSSSKSNEHIKANIDDAHHLDQSAAEEVEIISAQKTLNVSKRNSTNSISYLTTSTSTHQPSISEQNSSTGVIDEQMAVLLLAKYGKRIRLYNVDADGTVLQKKQIHKIGIGKGKKLAANETSLTLTMEEQHSSQPTTIDPSEIDAEFDVINANENTSERHNLIEIVPQKRGGAIVAREISFQSSFDTAGLMKNAATKTTKCDKECSKNSTKNNVEEKANDETKLQKESSISMEDEETLNQITPIPSTLELSS